MCGIFGQITNTPRKINIPNIKILGMLNESRGRNSCGITYDGKIQYGLDGEKLWTDFIKGKNFNVKKNPVVFGHTRMSSVGAVNESNAHPFGFGVNEEGTGFKFIGVHNGTLLNHKELAIKYDVETSQKYINKWGHEETRQKIDSELLLEIIHKTRRFHVLSEYNGRAALVWTDTDEPNIAYLWSGLSVPDEGDDFIKKAVEERPMIVYVESKNNCYFSSLKDSLHIIGGSAENTFQIDYNTVYRIVDGDFKNAVKIKISREKNYHTETTVYGGGYSHSRFPSVNRAFEKEKKEEINIYNDSPLKPIAAYKSKVYTSKFRFYRNGHLISGIYMDIPGHGLTHLTTHVGDVETAFKSIQGFAFAGNTFVKADKSTGKVIFKKGEPLPKLYYFKRGVMLLDKIDYIKITNNPEIGDQFEKLSHLSVHPVIDIDVAYKTKNYQQIFKDGKNFNGIVSDPFFEKIYTVRYGDLTEYSVNEEETVNKFGFDEDLYKTLRLRLEANEDETIAFETKVEGIIEEDNDLESKEMVYEYMVEVVCDLELMRDELLKIRESVKINNYILKADTLIEKARQLHEEMASNLLTK
jgi:predicted glutamine amidotransferase